jgi:hypothetical protein
MHMLLTQKHNVLWWGATYGVSCSVDSCALDFLLPNSSSASSTSVRTIEAAFLITGLDTRIMRESCTSSARLRAKYDGCSPSSEKFAYLINKKQDAQNKKVSKTCYQKMLQSKDWG